MAFDQDQFFHWRFFGAPGGEEGEIGVGNVAADQETPRPLPVSVLLYSLASRSASSR